MPSENVMVEAAPRSEKAMSYDDALLYCAFCNYGGHTDWRMPSQSEHYLVTTTEQNFVCWYTNLQERSRHWWAPNGGNLDAEWYVIPVRYI